MTTTPRTRTVPSIAPEPPLADLLDDWVVALQAARKAPGTVNSYRRSIRQYLAWLATNDLPERIDKRYVQRWTVELLELHEPATARIRQLALRRFARWLVAEGELAEFPLDGLRPPKVDEKLVPGLTEDQVTRLMKSTGSGSRKGREWRDIRDEAMLRLMIETGLRAGEVVLLTTDAVDVKRRLAEVRRAKGGKARTVSFSPKTSESLARWMRVRRTHRYAPLPELFLTHLGPLTYAGVYNIVERRASLAGLDIHPHTLRHTMANRWLARGGSEGGLMAMAGWTDPAMIKRYAGAEAASRAAEEADRLDLGAF